MMSSSRDNWERLVAAVLKRDEIRQLCHQNSISTMSSDSQRTYSSSGDLSRILSILNRIPVSPPRQPPLISASGLEASKNASGPITRKLFSASLWRRKPKDYNLGQSLVGIPEDHFGLESFSLRELLVATDNFSNNNFLGHGGLGKVYKGRLADGSLVQVTRLRQQEIEINLEITSIAAHCNVLRARGFCFTQKEKLLVYPCMVNKSVAFWLRDRDEPRPPLDWPTRKQISLGAAKGLAYLHYVCPRKIIHRDVKAENILLDENFEAVVADLTLGEFVDCCDNDIVFPLKGTIGHIAPEYLARGKCSVKIDVFGYGMFLLELITAQRAFDLARHANDDDVMLLDWVKTQICKDGEWKVVVDADLQGNFIDEEVEELLLIALICTQGNPEERPTMLEVVRMLDVAYGLVEMEAEWFMDDFEGDTLERRYVEDFAVSSSNSLRPVSSFPSPQLPLTNDSVVEDRENASKTTTQELFSALLWKRKATNYKVSQGLAVIPEYCTTLRRFSLDHLRVATDNFSHRHVLGHGGHSTVYKGRLGDGSLVAVKKLWQRVIGIELEMASLVKHRNVIELIGFCITQKEQLLVYPYMANGSVASCLRSERCEGQPSPLTWPVRKTIALGVAKGLSYLNQECPRGIIHRDVKAANILLDENFKAFVADFSLAKFMDCDDDDGVVGTRSHIAPEYLSIGKYCAEKTDVFSYGIFLVELITGKQIPHLLRQLACVNSIKLLDLVSELCEGKEFEAMIDPDLRGNYVEEEVEKLIRLALICTQSDPHARPTMLEFVRMFEDRDDIAEKWEELLHTKNSDGRSRMSFLVESDLISVAERFKEHLGTEWIILDSSSNVAPEELSEPR